MDTTPPQQEMIDQANPSYGEAPVELQRSYSSRMWWILILALMAGWIWMSWLYGWFPFSSEVTATSEKTMQDIPQNVLDSLTAPIDPPIDTIPQSVLDSLTAPAESPLPDSDTP